MIGRASIFFILFPLFLFAAAAYPGEVLEKYSVIKGSDFTAYNTRLVDGILSFERSDGAPSNCRAAFFMRNVTKLPLSFEDAKYSIVKKDGVVYALEFEKVYNNTGIRNSQILNPFQNISIRCQSPVFPDAETKEVCVQLKDGRKIVFLPTEEVEKLYPDE